MRRYPGTTPFKPEDAPVYKGRTTETQDVTNLVLTQKTLVLFARSGMGKTSLLNAGVVPKLKQYNFYPVFIRFNEIGSGTTDDPVTRFMAQYQETYQAFTASRSRATPFSPQSTLWEMMCQNQLVVRRDALIPTLIFDQFEEFFRTYPQRDQRITFLKQLAELLSDTIPHQQPLPGQQATVGGEVKPLNIRVVFSIRSDLLNLMQEVSDYLPFVMRTRYELLPMTSDQATEAIRGPGQVADGPYECGPITFPDAVKDDILTGLRDPFSGEFEPFQLQLVCSYLEDKYVGQDKGKAGARSHTVKKEDYGGIQGIQNINEVYFSDTINAITEQPRAEVMTALITLLNKNDNRILKEDSQLDLKPPVKDKLVDRRIMKRDKIQANVYYEISHDKIALALQKEKARIEAEQRKEQEQIEEERKNKQRLADRKKLAFIMLSALIGLVALVVSVFAVKLTQANRTLIDKQDTLNSTVNSLTTTQAMLTATVNSLSLAENQLKKDAAILDSANQNLNKSVNALNLARLRKAQDDFKSAKALMRGKLFAEADQALNHITVDKSDKQYRKSYRILGRAIREAKKVCNRMQQVRKLYDEAQCLELNFRIACAKQHYQDALAQQKTYDTQCLNCRTYYYSELELERKIKTADITGTSLRIGLTTYGYTPEQVIKMNIDNKDSCACERPKRLQL